MVRQGDIFLVCLKAQPVPDRLLRLKGVASSAVEHSAFNRLVLSSNLRRPIYRQLQVMIGVDGLRYGNVYGAPAGFGIQLRF